MKVAIVICILLLIVGCVIIYNDFNSKFFIEEYPLIIEKANMPMENVEIKLVGDNVGHS